MKKREPTKPKVEPTPEAIAAFAAEADGGTVAILPVASSKGPDMDPEANRKHKAIRVGFNEYEYDKLLKLARKVKRSKLGTLRWAMLKAAEDEGV